MGKYFFFHENILAICNIHEEYNLVIAVKYSEEAFLCILYVCINVLW
jgi:hypothetical protein